MKAYLKFAYAGVLYFLVACANTDTKKIPLTIWLDTNDKEMRFFKQLSHEIEKQHPRFKLRLRFISFDNLKPRFQGQVGETREPDILYLMNDWIGELVEQNLLRPLSNKPEGLLPQALQSMTYNHQLYGAPFALQTIGLIYNRQFIKTPPQNTADLLQLAQKKHKHHYPLIYDQSNFYYHAPWFHACGGRVFDARGHLALEAEPLRKSLSWALSLQNQGVVPKGSSYSVMVNLFSDRQASLMVSGPWSMSILEENRLDYGVAALPQNNCPAPPKAFIGVKGFGLNRLSEHAEEAEEVIQYLSSRQVQTQVLNQLDNLPVRSDVYDQSLNGHKQVFYDQIREGIPMPNHPVMKYVWQEMNWLLGQVLAGQPIDPKLNEALARLQKRVKEHESN